MSDDKNNNSDKQESTPWLAIAVLLLISVLILVNTVHTVFFDKSLSNEEYEEILSAIPAAQFSKAFDERIFYEPWSYPSDDVGSEVIQNHLKISKAQFDGLTEYVKLKYGVDIKAHAKDYPDRIAFYDLDSYMIAIYRSENFKPE